MFFLLKKNCLTSGNCLALRVLPNWGIFIWPPPRRVQILSSEAYMTKMVITRTILEMMVWFFIKYFGWLIIKVFLAAVSIDILLLHNLNKVQIGFSNSSWPVSFKTRKYQGHTLVLFFWTKINKPFSSGFHIFKLFVGNPRKNPGVYKTIYTNKEQIMEIIKSTQIETESLLRRIEKMTLTPEEYEKTWNEEQEKKKNKSLESIKNINLNKDDKRSTNEVETKV